MDNKKPHSCAGLLAKIKSCNNSILIKIFSKVNRAVVQILLKYYTRSRRLTECLAILEFVGITGEAALAHLRQLQGGARC